MFGLHHTAFALVSPDPQEIIRLVNEQRTARGLNVFKENEALNKAAELKAKEIANLGSLVHTKAPSGTQWWNTAQSGYYFQSIGENLAANIPDPSTLVMDWINSPVHSVNILNPLYTEIGVATVPGIFRGSAGSYTVEYTAIPKTAIELTISTSDTSAKPVKISIKNSYSQAELAEANENAKNLQIQAIIKQLMVLMDLYLRMISSN